MKRLILTALSTASLAFAAPDLEKLKAELASTEAAFCALGRERGVLAAFEHFAAPKAVFFDVDPRKVRGVEAVRRRLADFPAGARLTWAPEEVDVAASGDLGYTWGRYEYRLASTVPGQPDSVGQGFYLTLWKRQPDGQWRYVLDTGSPDVPAKKP
jgi:ketosteroid isomerase-like protein